jgi:hypothetical protein
MIPSDYSYDSQGTFNPLEPLGCALACCLVGFVFKKIIDYNFEKPGEINNFIPKETSNYKPKLQERISNTELQNIKQITAVSEQEKCIPAELLRLLGFTHNEKMVSDELAENSHDEGSNQADLMQELGFSVDPASPPEENSKEQLSQDKLLEDAMNGSSGTSEGYSVGTHSALVLRTFEQHFRKEFSPIEQMSLGQFRIFLALHDSGKSFAMERKYSLSAKALKDEELKNCRAIIGTVGKQLAWSKETIELSQALLAADTIGNYCQNKITLEEAKEELENIAPSFMSVKEFTSLMIQFHKSDAGSYKIIRCLSGTFTVSKSGLEYSPNRLRLMKELLSKMDFPGTKSLQKAAA